MNTAARFHDLGGPDVISLDVIDVPEPGPGQVRIRTRAWGLNRADVMFRTGNHFAEPSFPQAQGLEASGTIDAVGPEVTHLTPGDVVSVVPAFALTDYTLHAELALAPARAVVKHPDRLSWEEGAALWMAYATAYGALIDIAGLNRGDVVVIPAASSSVGLAAIQIATMVGARPIALSRTSDKHDTLLRAGASEVLATETDDVTARLLDLTDGAGVNIVFDPVAGPGLTSLLAATARYAAVVIYGALSPEPSVLPLLSLLQKRLTIRGYDMVEVVSDDARLARAVEFITAGVASGALTPVVDRVFPAEQIAHAYAYMETNSQVGKVIVTAPQNGLCS